MVRLVNNLFTKKVFIIAEAGINHNGNLEIAKKLVNVAVDAGCNAVKFQTFKAENIASKHAKQAEYQIKNTAIEESQYEMLKRLELSEEYHYELIKHCHACGIMFMSTPFDEESGDILEKMGVEVFKIPSGEITNLPFLRHIARKGKPIILSTGMSYIGEIEEALNEIREEGNNQILLLHCVSNYPAKFEDVNLNAMITMKNTFKIETGYSDHTLGIAASIAAVALGAKVIEKHFTLDRDLKGPDHKASLIPEELNELVKSIRNIEKALGDGIKKPAVSEQNTIEVARKSIVAKVDIKKGMKISSEMLCIKRPGTGIQPKFSELIIGAQLKEDLEKDQILEWRHIL